MSSYDDSDSREWVINNFPKKHLPNRTIRILENRDKDIFDLRGVDKNGNTTIFIEVQVRKYWNNQPYRDWTEKKYGNRNWGHTTEERKWNNHFQQYNNIPLIYIIINNCFNRCIFAERDSILSGEKIKREHYWGASEVFSHTNDYTELSI